MPKQSFTPFSRATHPGPVDVLVGHSFYMALDRKQAEKARPYPPLATLYVAAWLKAHGYRVAVFDAMLAPDESAFEAALHCHTPRAVLLFEDNFNFLTKMCLGRMRTAALRMIELATAQGLPVAVSGSDATDEPMPFLAAGADTVLPGEADHTALEWLAARLTGGQPEGIAGIAYLDSSRHLDSALYLDSARHLVRTPARAPERQIDRFGWPARDLVDLEAYRAVWLEHHGSFSLNMMAARGCPFHCNWCAKPIWGQRYAIRRASDVAAEMAELKHAVRPDHIWFADDIFGLRPRWTAEFGRAVEELDAAIPFSIQSRVDLMNEEAVDGLARAGCRAVWLGVESGSQRILDAMEKGIRLEDVAGAVNRLRRHGLRACFFLQFGYPGETWSDILATAQMVRDLLPDEIGVSVTYPLPGTRFYDSVAAELGAERHWQDSRDLRMLFQGTYTSDFYRALHALLHRELDLRLALAASGAAETSELVGIERAWQDLAAWEPAARSARPTAVAVSAVQTAAPDLSQMAN